MRSRNPATAVRLPVPAGLPVPTGTAESSPAIHRRVGGHLSNGESPGGTTEVLCVSARRMTMAPDTRAALGRPLRAWDRCATRLATFDELRSCDTCADSDWLTLRERAELARLRHPRRRETWRLGRLLAKRLLLEAAPEPLDGPEDLEILSRDSEFRAVRPQVRLRGRRVPWCLSIAHAAGAALAAVAFDRGTTVGVDLVRPQALPPGFLETWFTERERNWLTSQPAETVAVCWGLKEAVYKACQRGEAFVPRRVEILQDGSHGVVCMYDGIPLATRARIAIERFDGRLAITVLFDEFGPP
jgi:phosphopantetheinyl transferase